MAQYSYLKFFQDLYLRQERKYAFHASTKEEFFHWRDAFRNELWNVLGLDSLKTVWQEAGLDKRFLNQVQTVEKVQEKGYTRWKYILETLPGVFMPFYVLVPDRKRDGERLPAVIAVPAHGANKDTVAGVPSCPEVIQKLKRSPKESYGKNLVQKGYIVFCPDSPGYGERIEHRPSEDRAFMLDTHLCPCNYAPRLWRLGDISDICSMIAPRPLYVENGCEDPLNGKRGSIDPKEQVERIRRACGTAAVWRMVFSKSVSSSTSPGGIGSMRRDIWKPDHRGHRTRFR